LLFILYEKRAQPERKLSSRLGVPDRTLRTMLSRLMRLGLVTSDSINRYYLTPMGRKVVEALMDILVVIKEVEND